MIVAQPRRKDEPGSAVAAKGTGGFGVRSVARLLFLGPMLGVHQGWVTTQGEILARLFSREGWPVEAVSSRIHPGPRSLEMVSAVLMRRGSFDLAFLQVFGGRSFIIEDAVSLACQIRGLPCIMTLRGGGMPDFVDRHRAWVLRVLGRATRIVAPSEFLKEVVSGLGLASVVIPNVLELDKYPFRERRAAEPRLLWMRTFHNVYNPELAVRAFKLVREEFPAATLVMAGQEKGLGPAVRNLVRKLGLWDAVEFPGFLEFEDKAREASRAALFLNTNRIDNMPVSVVEAGAFGLPIVATAVGGVRCLLQDGITGLLVRDDDPQAMAQAILRVLRDPGLAGRLSRGSRALAERSGWPLVRPQWERVIQEARA